jgi:hypothetical protein
MPIRQGGILANRGSTWPRDHFCRGRPRAVAHYLIMMDLAAIFEYLTRKRATRSVRGEDHFAYGAEYGAFWDFAQATWPAIFKSTNGLKSAMKNWAVDRVRYGEASPLIANMHLRHPEWGLFGK